MIVLQLITWDGKGGVDRMNIKIIMLLILHEYSQDNSFSFIFLLGEDFVIPSQRLFGVNHVMVALAGRKSRLNC